MIRRAPAKVNLGLVIHRRRPDGYHDLSTIFLKISLADVIHFEEIPREVVVHCDHPEVPSDRHNLIAKAAMLLQPLAPGRGVRLRLQKTVPVAAGLGGGSSDAATTLLGLNTLWELRLSRAELARYATRLGADVPFFLLPTIAALGCGRGDELEPVDCLRDFFLVLVKPSIAVSTAWAYRQFTFELTVSTNNTNMLKQHLESGDIASLGAELSNDLEAVVLQRFPVVQEVKQALMQPGVHGVCMSGSGPTVYALCSSSGVAHEVASIIRRRGWDVWVCHPWDEADPDSVA